MKMCIRDRDEGQYDKVIPVFWATGAALVIRRADYKEVGGLDGRFFAHMEEILSLIHICMKKVFYPLACLAAGALVACGGQKSGSAQACLLYTSRCV